MRHLKDRGASQPGNTNLEICLVTYSESALKRTQNSVTNFSKVGLFIKLKKRGKTTIFFANLLSYGLQLEGFDSRVHTY